MPVTIDLDKCSGNGACVDACAFFAVEIRDGKAVIFDNCTECGACVRACPTHAIVGDLFTATSSNSIVGIAFASDSGISATVDRLAKSVEASTAWYAVDPVDAGAAADAIARTIAAIAPPPSLVVVPHDGPGPAIAARVAARCGAHLVSRCSTLTVDTDGRVRATRLLFGGHAVTTSRAPAGLTVATLLPRAVRAVSPVSLEPVASDVAAGGSAPALPASAMRRAVAIDPSLAADTQAVARALAEALGAHVIDPIPAGTKPLALDLYVAIGIEGGTEHNALFRESRTVVAIVDRADAPIVSIADYLLVGDVAEHLKALVAMVS